VGGLLSKETLLRVQLRDFQREQKDEERAKGGGETWGEGRDRGKLQYKRSIY
jgi:hypothetical protein